MFTLKKRMLSAAAVIAALSGPATASAMINGAPSGGFGVSSQQARLQAYPPAIAKYQQAVGRSSAPVAGQPARVVSTSTTRQPSSQAAFEWGDAGIGAAGALVLIGVGSGAAAARRRRAGVAAG